MSEIDYIEIEDEPSPIEMELVDALDGDSLTIENIESFNIKSVSSHQPGPHCTEYL